jgi:hypothetical protein
MLELWQPDELVVFEPRNLERLGVPAATAQVLAEVGLPREQEPFFYADSEVSELAAADGGALWRIGTDGGVAITIRSGSQHVCAGAEEDGARNRFVNSSVDQFAQSLRAVTGPYRRFPELPDEEIDALLPEVEAAVRSIDAAVFDDPENWWMVLIEQMKDGLL